MKRTILTLTVTALLAASIVPVAAQAAKPPPLRQFCPTGSGAGQCSIPRGIAVDPKSGDVYVADQNNNRIEKFTAWGDMLRAWGWDVVESGPDDTAPANGFEVCVPIKGDLCKGGLEGGGAGEFGGLGPQGVAVESAGNVYVVDWSNSRVQKFGPEGEFLLSFGGEVNKTKVEEVGATEDERNRCPVDPGDVCQAGTKGTGKGQFGSWRLGSYIATVPGSPEKIYVGDQERVQAFGTDGHYMESLPLLGETVNSLAADPVSGALYVTFFQPGLTEAKPGVHKLSSAGSELCTIEAHNPSALAIGPGGDVYVVDGNINVTPPVLREIVRFGSDCGIEELLFGPEGALGSQDDFTTNPTGIAASSACGIEGADLFISNPNQLNSYVHAYGPPPRDFEAPCNPPLKVPPTIADSYATSAGTDGATVKAKINPHFWPDTTYRVQYATAECIEAGGWEAACAKRQPVAHDISLGEEVTDANLGTQGVFLGGAEALAPDTAYRYRFVAQSSGGGPAYGAEKSFHTFPLPAPAKEDCANQAFRTAAAAFLPDCRAYEMVSPLDKNGGDVGSPREARADDQASPDGEALTYFSAAAFAEPSGAPANNQYIATRDSAAGWSTRSLTDPRRSFPLIFLEYLVPRYKLFSEDLCNGWLLQDTDVALVEGAPAGVAGLYRRRGLHEGCGEEDGYQLLSTIFPPGYEPKIEKGSNQYYPMIQGFSADGEVSVYRAAAALSSDACNTPDEGKGIFQVYLSREGTPGIAPKLISVLPNGEAACTHSSVGSAGRLGYASLFHAISTNGSRVFWSATAGATPPPAPNFEAGEEPGKLYLRLNATEPQSKIKSGKCAEPAAACTFAVSKEAEALSKTSASSYLSAAADGSVAIFQSGADLYEFDVAKALAKEPATALIAHKAKGIMGASADASRIYLVSEEALAPGATAGKPNLYLYERGAGFTFVATLEGEDLKNQAEISQPPSPIAILPLLRTSRVSPDGLHAAFASSDAALAESVAGYDNTDAVSGRPDSEIYLYDATANGGEGELLCASCNPSGARPSGKQVWSGEGGKSTLWAAAQIRGWTTSLHPGNVLSGNGGRLFFETTEALDPRDANGKQDVYEWERAEDKDDCLKGIGGELLVAQSHGCLSLISSGHGSDDAQFLDASADGADAFFTTGQSLLPQDPGLIDVYDARAQGGFPAPPSPPPACEGEACQGTPEAPNDPTPASSAFQGAGNVRETPQTSCRKPRVRRKGRCVAKKHHKRAHRRAANRNRRAAR